MTAGLGRFSARARATSIPSRPGMAMSSRSRSGFSAPAISTVPSPSLALPTRVTPSQRASSSCSRSEASGSSSAMRTRSGDSVIIVQRQQEFDAIAALLGGPEGAAGERAEAGGQALADIRDTVAGAGDIARFLGKRPPAAIGDADREPARAASRAPLL